MIILAFPGLGKTSLSLVKGGVVDLDYKYYSDAIDPYLHKHGEIRFIGEYADLAKLMSQDGQIVLLNLPDVVGLVDVERCYLPSDLTHVRPKFPGVHDALLWHWINDWSARCEEYGIPVFYIPSGKLSDYYMNPVKMSKRKGKSNRKKGGDTSVRKSKDRDISCRVRNNRWE